MHFSVQSANSINCADTPFLNTYIARNRKKRNIDKIVADEPNRTSNDRQLQLPTLPKAILLSRFL